MGTSSAQEMKARSPKEWGSQTIGGALRDCANRLGSRDLLVFREERISAQRLAEEVEHLALGLLALGINKGDTVAVWLPNLPETCVAELAIARIGAVMMAINTRYKATELEYVLRQSDSRALLLMPQFLTQDFLAVLKDVVPEFPNSQPGQLNAQTMPLLRHLIVLGDEQPGMFTYANVQQMGRDLLPQLHERENQVTSDDVVLLQYTSGTTAFPKAAMLAHGQVLRNASQMAVRAGIDETDHVLSAMPMFHVGGSVCALLGALTMGYVLYMGPVFDAGKTLEVIESEQITTYIGLESMFIALRSHEDFGKRSRASLRKRVDGRDVEHPAHGSQRDWHPVYLPVVRIVRRQPKRLHLRLARSRRKANEHDGPSTAGRRGERSSIRQLRSLCRRASAAKYVFAATT